MGAPAHIIEIYRKAGYPNPEETARLAWGDVATVDDDELQAAAEILDTCQTCNGSGFVKEYIAYHPYEIHASCRACNPSGYYISGTGQRIKAHVYERRDGMLRVQFDETLGTFQQNHVSGWIYPEYFAS